MERLLTFETCDDVSIVDLTENEEVSSFHFDVVYRFELSGDPDCLSKITTDAKGVFDCEEYPNRLVCGDARGNTLLFNVNQTKIDFVFAT